MSVEQLSNRLGVTRARVNQLEKAEVNDAVTLRTLREVADALECDLVYAIVPKGNSTLESIIKTRAEQVAKEMAERVSHTMLLEAQSVDVDIFNKQTQELAKDLANRFDKKFWTFYGGKNQNFIHNLAKKIYDELIVDQGTKIDVQRDLLKNINNQDIMNTLKIIFMKNKNEKNFSKMDLEILNKPEFINQLRKALILHGKKLTRKST
jgi:predicted DNA-binding mobile mystery protein A